MKLNIPAAGALLTVLIQLADLGPPAALQLGAGVLLGQGWHVLFAI